MQFLREKLFSSGWRLRSVSESRVPERAIRTGYILKSYFRFQQSVLAVSNQDFLSSHNNKTKIKHPGVFGFLLDLSQFSEKIELVVGPKMSKKTPACATIYVYFYYARTPVPRS